MNVAGRAKQSVILLSAQGQRFTQQVAAELAGLERIVLVCGRYEGVDERVADFLADRELSIGDFICNGGEVPAMVVIDAVIRYVPGVLGDENSTTEESHSVPGRLEYPQYTRPRRFRDMNVPDILLSGDHQAIARWRDEQSASRGQEENSETKPTENGDKHEE